MEAPPLEELEVLDVFVDEKNGKLLQICVWKPKGLITEVKRLDRNSIQLIYAGEIPPSQLDEYLIAIGLMLILLIPLIVICKYSL